MSDTNSPKRKQKTLSQILAICFVILFILSCQIQFPQPWIGMVIQGVLAGALVLIALNILKELQQETENTQHNILQNLKDKTEDLKEFVSKSDADIIQKMGLYQQFISQQQEETKNFLSNSFAEVKDKLEATDNALTEFISRQHEETKELLSNLRTEVNDKILTISTLFIEKQQKQAEIIKSGNTTLAESITGLSWSMNAELKKESERNAAQAAQTLKSLLHQHEETKELLSNLLSELKCKIETTDSVITQLFIDEQMKQTKEMRSNNAALTESITGLSLLLKGEIKQEGERSAAQTASALETLSRQHEEAMELLSNVLAVIKDKIETTDKALTMLFVEEQRKQIEEMKSGNKTLAESITGLSWSLNGELKKESEKSTMQTTQILETISHLHEQNKEIVSDLYAQIKAKLKDTDDVLSNLFLNEQLKQTNEMKSDSALLSESVLKLSQTLNNRLTELNDSLTTQFIAGQKKQTEETNQKYNVLSDSLEKVKTMIIDEHHKEHDSQITHIDNVLTEVTLQYEETISSLRKMNLEINDKFLEFQNMISSLNSLFDKSYVSVSNAINSLINKEDVENAVFNVLSEFDQFEKIRIEISNLSRLFKSLSYSKTDEYTNPNRIETINDEANKLLIRNHYEHNKIKKSEMLKDGKISYLVNYDTFGNISDSISYDNNGLIMMQTTYYSNGQIKQRIEFKNGKKFAVANFNENGEKQK